MYMLRLNEDHGNPRNVFSRFQKGFEAAFDHVRGFYHDLLTKFVVHRKIFIPVFLGLCLCTFLLVPWLGQDFFPQTDSGQFILHVRAKTGTRLEETARLSDLVEDSIRKKIPDDEVDNILDNIGLPYSPLNTMHSTSGGLDANDVEFWCLCARSTTLERIMCGHCGESFLVNFQAQPSTFCQRI
jgi:multidrug efflux pump subunit AcrB